MNILAGRTSEKSVFRSLENPIGQLTLELEAGVDPARPVDTWPSCEDFRRPLRQLLTRRPPGQPKLSLGFAGRCHAGAGDFASRKQSKQCGSTSKRQKDSALGRETGNGADSQIVSRMAGKILICTNNRKARVISAALSMATWIPSGRVDILKDADRCLANANHPGRTHDTPSLSPIAQ